MVEYQGEVIITGGHSGFEKTSTVSSMKIRIEKWTRQPTMIQKRSNHACGIMHSEAHSGRPILVVTGGTKTIQGTTEFVFLIHGQENTDMI